MTYLLLLASTLLTGVITILKKFLQKSLQLNFSNFTFYSFINGAVGSLFLFASCGFRPQINAVTITYALIYGAVVFISLVAGLLFLSENPVSLYTLTDMAGALIPSALVGILFLREPFSPKLVLSVILMLIALMLPYIKTKNKSFKAQTALFCLLLFAAGGGNVIVIKLFSLTGAHAESMFFLTNVLLFILCGAILLTTSIVYKQKHKGFTWKQYANISLSTCLSNVTSVLSAYILAKMTISTYTVLNSSLILIVGAFVSVLLFKEKSTRENNIALVLAIVSIILSV
ncbi:MAG: hypothetical protein IJD83_09135 [Clostridia bacterium]|nr:hypothetical protein [Clostridia bacterium]